MSCDGNRAMFCAHVSADPAVVTAVGQGDSTRTAALLDELYDLGCRQQRASEAQATALTRLLFAQMRTAGITPPTHSKDGLPRPESRQGYALLYQTLHAIRTRHALPEVAVQLIISRTPVSATPAPTPASATLGMARRSEPDTVAVVIEGTTMYVTGGDFWQMKAQVQAYAQAGGARRSWDGVAKVWRLPGTRNDLETSMGSSGYTVQTTRPMASTTTPTPVPGLTPVPPPAGPIRPIPTPASHTIDPNLPPTVATWVASITAGQQPEHIAACANGESRGYRSVVATHLHQMASAIHAEATRLGTPAVSPLVHAATALATTALPATEQAFATAWLMACDHPRCPICGQWVSHASGHTCPVGTPGGGYVLLHDDGRMIMRDPTSTSHTFTPIGSIEPRDPVATASVVPMPLPAHLPIPAPIPNLTWAHLKSGSDDIGNWLRAVANDAGAISPWQQQAVFAASANIQRATLSPDLRTWIAYLDAHPTDPTALRQMATTLLTMASVARCPQCQRFVHPERSHCCQVGMRVPFYWSTKGHAMAAPAFTSTPMTPRELRAIPPPRTAPGRLPPTFQHVLSLLTPASLDERTVARLRNMPLTGTTAYGEIAKGMADAILYYGAAEGVALTEPLMQWARVIAAYQRPTPQRVHEFFIAYAMACGIPRCTSCGQFVSSHPGTVHTCAGAADQVVRFGRLVPKERSIADAAASALTETDPINNPAMADLWGRIASTIAGHPCTVVLRPGSGFATDMQGTIYADPFPLGPSADLAHNLVVTKAGIYHEIGHELVTPPEDWASVLAIANGTETVPGIDAGRAMITTIYNIVEDGRMERAISDQFAGVAETLAASCVLHPRWHERVGVGVPLVDEVIWPLLYTALPYFHLRDEVRAAMSPAGRALFAELEPIARTGATGTSDDSLAAAITITRRLEAAGILTLPNVGTPPPPPPPGTKTRTQSGKGTPGQSGQAGASGKSSEDAGQDDQGGQERASGSSHEQDGQEGQTGTSRASGKSQEEQEHQEGQAGASGNSPAGQDSQEGQTGTLGSQPERPQEGASGSQDAPDSQSEQPDGPPPATLGGDGGGQSRRAGDGTATDRFAAVRRALTPERLDGIVADLEAQAVGAMDRYVSRQATPNVLGAALHAPLTNRTRTTTKQTYRNAVGAVQSVLTDQPISDNALLVGRLKSRQPVQREIAGRLARKLDSIRQETLVRLRQETEGRLDRRRIVAAMTGQDTIRTRSRIEDSTGMAVSVLLDQSGSMGEHIRNGAVYDAASILGQTFETLDVPYEIRGHGGSSTQYKAIDDPTFDPARAAQLVSDTTGSNAITAPVIGAATSALLACETPNRLIVNVMDGEMDDHAATVAHYTAARKQGLVTFGVFLGNPGVNQQQKMTEIFGKNQWRPIATLTELPAIVGKRIADIFESLGGDS